MSTPRLVLVTGHGAAVEAVAFSPDGRTLATCGQDRLVLLWDVSSGTLRAHLEGHPTGVRAAAFSPDGALLATCDYHDQLRLWDTATGKWLGTIPRVTSPVAFAPEPGQLIARSGDGLVLLDYESGEVICAFGASLRPGLQTAALAPDASGAVDCDPDQERELVSWDFPTGAERLRRRLPDYFEVPESEAVGMPYRKFQVDVQCLALSPCGRHLAAGGSFALLWLCDGRTGRLRQLAGNGYRGTEALAFSGSGRRLAAGGADGAIRIWAVGSGAKQLQVRSHDGWVSALAFSPDGRRIASGGHDMAAAIWTARTGDCFRPLHARQYAVRSLAFSPDGKLLAAGQEDGTIRFWSTRTGRLLGTLEAREPWVNAIAFSPDGSRFFAGSSNGYFLDCCVESWASGTWEPGPCLELERGYIDSLVYLPAGDLVAVSHHSRRERRRQATTQLWDPESGRVRHDLHGASAAAFPDGRVLATTFGTSSAGTIRLWDLRSGEVVRDLDPSRKPDSYDSLCFSPDGRSLAVGFNGCRVGCWDVATGTQLWEGRTQRDALSAIAYSPNGETIAFGGSYDETIVLWDARRGYERQELCGHTNPLRALAYSPDGTRLASASTDGTVKVWCPGSGRLIATLRLLETVGDAPEEWIAYTPEGYYQGSQGAQALIRWKVGEELLPAERYCAEFHQPERVAEALQGGGL